MELGVRNKHSGLLARGSPSFLHTCITLPPSHLCQMLYSSTPLWAAAMARLLLGDQGLGPTGWAGGAVMLAAALAAALMGGRRDGAAGQAAAAAPVAALAGGVVALAVTPGAGGGAPRLGRHDE